ncbi:hypothetical protein [Rhodoplanes sp. Z2-YC6860]|uniref:hypothetical protein n=1 Tax=Rhodoplanes sp. Z2-YC6860 TaxID=674703 RepID=UPI00078E36D8|nr:hypothetical protein [Rhodoplanes sp. Z2-YC6860]AMN39089.1 hypothetical protein RHPLAN_06270 [Rhodoplanes sp. Z2-YC6860]
MDIVEFEDLLDRLGEDISTWPVDKQRPAAKLLSESSEAQDLIRDAMALRGLMARPPISAPSGLSERIFERAASLQEPRKESHVSAAYRLLAIGRQHWGAIFAACFMAGVVTGLVHSHFRNPAAPVAIHDYVAYVLNFTYNID